MRSSSSKIPSASRRKKRGIPFSRTLPRGLSRAASDSSARPIGMRLVSSPPVPCRRRSVRTERPGTKVCRKSSIDGSFTTSPWLGGLFQWQPYGVMRMLARFLRAPVRQRFGGEALPRDGRDALPRVRRRTRGSASDLQPPPYRVSHDSTKHPGHELFCAEPVCFRAGLSTGSGFKNQLKDALSQFRYRCLTVQDLTAINVHIICHSPV